MGQSSSFAHFQTLFNRFVRWAVKGGDGRFGGGWRTFLINYHLQVCLIRCVAFHCKISAIVYYLPNTLNIEYGTHTHTQNTQHPIQRRAFIISQWFHVDCALVVNWFELEHFHTFSRIWHMIWLMFFGCLFRVKHFNEHVICDIWRKSACFLHFPI